MKRFLLLASAIILTASFLSAQVSVHVSGTVTRVSTNVPVVGHEVIITADSNAAGFTYWGQRFTNPNGFYDCTIPNVPSGVQIVFIVKTKNCDSLYIVHDFLSSNSPATVNFVLCNATTGCEAGFSAAADSTNPLKIHFLDQSSPAGQVTSWHWDFGDGSPAATTHDPWHIYAAPGTYNVCLTIATSGGCTSIKCVPITVHASNGCEAHYTFTHDSVNQPPVTLHFFDTSTGNPTAWEWTFGDPGSGTANVSHLQNPTHVFSAPGVYNVCLYIHGTNCQSSYCDSISAGPGPVNCESWFTFGRNFLTVNFEGHTHSTLATAWNWNFGDPGSGGSNTSAGQNPHHTYSAPGLYTVTLHTEDSNGCGWTSTQTIFVAATCDLFGHVTMGNTFVDHGIIELIRVDSGNVMTVVQTKELGDSAGYYQFGGVYPGHYYLKAHLLPASARYGDFLPTYYNGTVNWTSAQLIELGVPQNPYNFHLVEVGLLSPGGGTIGGTIVQGVKISAGGSPAPDVEVLLFNNLGQPVAVTTTDMDGHFEFSNLGWATYLVYPEVTGLTTSPAMVVVSSENPVVNTPFTMTGSQVVYGIRDDLPGSITAIGNFYPNPLSGGFTSLKITASAGNDLAFDLYDLTGQVVRTLTQAIHKGDNLIRFNVTSLPAGPYYLKIRSEEGGSVFRKLFIVK